MDNQKYVLEADPNEVEKIVRKFKENPTLDEDIAQKEDGSFRYVQSSASCNFSKVKGIVYGGISSRFWMLRKHMNSIDPAEYRKKKVPFYAW